MMLSTIYRSILYLASYQNTEIDPMPILLVLVMMPVLLYAQFILPGQLERFRRARIIKAGLKGFDWKYIAEIPYSLDQKLRVDPIFDNKRSSFSHYIEGSLGTQQICLFDYRYLGKFDKSEYIVLQTVVGFYSPEYIIEKPLKYKKRLITSINDWIYVYNFNEQMPVKKRMTFGDIQRFVMDHVFDTQCILDHAGIPKHKKTVQERLEEIPIMNDEFKNRINIYPQDWPDKPLDVKPGDLNKFALKGVGPCCGLTLMPWQDADSIPKRLNYYSYDKPTSHPFAAAPMTEDAGGVVYFSAGVDQPAFDNMLKIMLGSMGWWGKHYAVFIQKSQSPQEEYYLTQLRIVSRFALRFMYNAVNEEEYDSFPQQECSLNECLWSFIEDQRKIWNYQNLDGMMGGDGDMAYEKLAFGFMVENNSDGVYRIWSRAWLITK
jgi:hypothetical protein